MILVQLASRPTFRVIRAVAIGKTQQMLSASLQRAVVVSAASINHIAGSGLEERMEVGLWKGTEVSLMVCIRHILYYIVFSFKQVYSIAFLLKILSGSVLEMQHHGFHSIISIFNKIFW